MKIEECIKKRREHYEESLQRAVEAEVSLGHLVTDVAGCRLFTLCINTHVARWGY